ncbi:hypothetical protein JHK84_034416 [Glycine max]|nr:hypothetical protein JHK84_034416 [Glycine max]
MSFGRSLLPFCCFKSYVVDSHINGTGNLINHLLKKCLKFPKESLDPSQQTFAFAQMKKEDGKGTNSVLTNVHFDVNGASRQALARIINVVELNKFQGTFIKGPFMLNLLHFSAAFRKDNRGNELCQGRAMVAFSLLHFLSTSLMNLLNIQVSGTPNPSAISSNISHASSLTASVYALNYFQIPLGAILAIVDSV